MRLDSRRRVSEAHRQPAASEAGAGPGCPGRSLIDPREPTAFAAGRVPGAINFPRGLLALEVDHYVAAGSGRDCRIAVDRGSGARVAPAVKSRQRLGYRHVRSGVGGIMRRAAPGTPVATAVPPAP